MTKSESMDVAFVAERYEALGQAIGQIVIGQQVAVRQIFVTLMVGGHSLIEGVPGVAKTLLVRTLASAVRLNFGRIQFTPDLMPSDILGSSILDPSNAEFRFREGPIFSELLLADEINRAPAKTQSALLEAMQEHSVTVGGQTHDLGKLFMVMATQNPLEMEGTYPLPEAQLDRFFCKLLVKFPSTEDIESILDRTTETAAPQATACVSGDRIVEMSALSRRIPITEDVRRYGISLVMATHSDSEQATEMTRRYVRYGSSPRGAQALILAAKIRAILDQRYHVAREDLSDVAHSVLRHRLILNFEGQAESIQADDVIEDILKTSAEAVATA